MYPKPQFHLLSTYLELLNSTDLLVWAAACLPILYFLSENRLSLSAIILVMERDNRLLDSIFGMPTQFAIV